MLTLLSVLALSEPLPKWGVYRMDNNDPIVTYTSEDECWLWANVATVNGPAIYYCSVVQEKPAR